MFSCAVKLITVIQIVSVCSSALVIKLNRPRIVGGRNITIDQVPWQVSIHYYPVNHCGGSIINDDTILTAAHCFHETGTDPDAYTVRAGTHRRSTGGEIYKVRKIITHPGFKIDNYSNDIAIIKLQSKMDFNERILPILLPEFNEKLPVGEYGIVTGFGKLGVDLLFPQILQQVYLEILEQSVCQARYEAVTTFEDHMFCAGGDGIHDACGGDSGGPFVVHGKLFGITSFGIKCALPEYPGVFTRVADFINWITENIDS